LSFWQSELSFVFHDFFFLKRLDSRLNLSLCSLPFFLGVILALGLHSLFVPFFFDRDDPPHVSPPFQLFKR